MYIYILWVLPCMCDVCICFLPIPPFMHRREVGGWGRDPQKCTGRDWGMGSSTIEWALRPVVKYHLRRGVGLIKFVENGTRPQPPTSRIAWVFMLWFKYCCVNESLVYVYMCTYMYIYTHVHISVYMWDCGPCACMYMRVCIFTICMYVYIPCLMCGYGFWIYVHTYICIFNWMHIHIWLLYCTSVYIYICICNLQQIRFLYDMYIYIHISMILKCHCTCNSIISVYQCVVRAYPAQNMHEYVYVYIHT